MTALTTQNLSSFFLPNGLRRCGRYDTIFYGAYAGIGSTFDMRVRFDLKQKINTAKLQKAADRALRAYPEFAVRPVLHEGRICYETNSAPVKLAPDDGKRLYFGTEDTNGYLFVFLYGERHLSFSIFHSQTDAHGMIGFLVTVMWNYLVAMFPPARLLGTKMFTRHGIRADDSLFYTMDDTERYDPLTKFARPGNMVQPVDLERLFRFPPEDAPKDCASCHLVNLEISNAVFLAKVKELGTTFAPLLGALTAEAIRDCFDVGDRDVVVITTADGRRVVPSNTLGNLAYNVYLPVTPQIAALPLKAQCEKLAEQLATQRTEAHVRATYKDILRQCDEIDAMGDIDKVNAFLTGPEGLANSMTGTGTVFLTYPGRIANNPISGVLLDGLSPGILAAERAIDVYAHRDALIIQFSQKSDDPSLIDAMRHTLEKHGFAVKMRDLGRVTQNVFDFDKIKHV